MRSMIAKLASVETRDEALEDLRGKPETSTNHAPAKTHWPASAVQEQLWVLDQIKDIGSAYNVTFVLEVRGTADADAVQSAVWKALERHDGLNTAFARSSSEQGVVQFRRDDPLRPADFTVEDCDVEQAQRIADSQARKRLSLTRGPLVQVRILRIDPQTHWIVLVAHHAVIDGWSVNILTGDIARLLSNQRLSPAQSWSTYIASSAGSSVSTDAAISYWRKSLSETVSKPAGLQPDKPTAHPTLDAGTLRFTLPPGTVSPQHAADRLGVSLFALHFAAYQMAIGTVAKLETVVTGVPLLNREHHTTASLIGPLSNTLPIKLDITGSPSEIVRAADQATKQALAMQSAPVQEIIKDLPGLDRSKTNPLFNQLFNLGNLPGTDGRITAGNIQIVARGVPNNTSRVGFELTLESSAESTAGRLEYDLSLYFPETALRVLEEYQSQLRSLCENAR